jgi:hypothetical protein
LYVLASASTSAGYEAEEQYGLEGEEKDAKEEEDEYETSPSGNWNPHLMRRMYSDCLAGRGRFSAERLRLEARLEAMRDALAMKENEEEEAEEARRVFMKQRRFFGLADDGRGFRDPFLEMGISKVEVGDMLKVGVSPKTKVRMNSEGSVGRALRDETLHGLMVSPRIVGSEGGDATTTAHPTIEAATPEKEGAAYKYMFDGWSSFSPKDGNAEDHEGVEKQNEIVNPFADQFAVPGNEWTALSSWKRESGSSDYSTRSQPSSPVPHMRQGEELSYSPIQNPWMNAFDSLSARSQFQHAANEFFSGFDVETLVALTQGPGYELAETESGKGSPELFHLTPHKPKPSCGCEFCYRHHQPTLEILKAHDPSAWCHCSACRDFRDNRDVEKNRAELNAAWKARLDELAAEVDDTKAEEESRLLDLSEFKEEDNLDEFKPKKTHKLGAWVRSHLRCLTPRE